MIDLIKIKLEPQSSGQKNHFIMLFMIVIRDNGYARLGGLFIRGYVMRAVTC